jgi:hypothetical protein
LATGFLATQAASAAPRFEAEGSLVSYFDGKHTEEYSFRAYVDGCLWNIRTTLKTNPNPLNLVEFYEDAYDGGQLYKYIQFRKNDVPAGSPNTSEGTIEFNDVPHEKSFAAIPIWLALASSCYARSNQSFEPIFYTGNEASRFDSSERLKVDIKLHEASPMLPERMDFWNPGFVYQRDVNKRVQRHALKAPFDKGFIERQFRVNRFTNFGELTLPQEFTLESFQAKQDGKTRDDTISVHKWVATIERAKQLEAAPAIVPITDGKMFTADRRFAFAEPPARHVQYLNTNVGTWVPTSSPPLRRIYMTQADYDATVGSPPRLKKRRQGVAIAFLVMITIAFGLILRAKGRRTP